MLLELISKSRWPLKDRLPVKICKILTEQFATTRILAAGILLPLVKTLPVRATMYMQMYLWSTDLLIELTSHLPEMLERRFLEKWGTNLINFEESEMIREVAGDSKFVGTRDSMSECDFKRVKVPGGGNRANCFSNNEWVYPQFKKMPFSIQYFLVKSCYTKA